MECFLRIQNDEVMCIISGHLQLQPIVEASPNCDQVVRIWSADRHEMLAQSEPQHVQKNLD